ncbi:MAG: hypothetical protein IH797_00815, partial [Chloroflexi bacterium]|nr:hypothetical protein [Chloroflexota bacterium]
IQNFSILYAQQFSRQDLDDYCLLSDACRAIHKTAEGATILAGLLPHCMALNFFVQPSSRTFLSFGAAEAIRESAGGVLSEHDRARFEEAGTRTEAALGHKEFAGLVERGAALSFEDVIEYARAT